MKSMRYLASALATMAVWGISTFIITDFIVVFGSLIDLLMASIILLYALLSTIAIWWIPNFIIRADDEPCHGLPVNGIEDTPITPLAASPLTDPDSRTWWRMAFFSALLSVLTGPAWLVLQPERFPISVPIWLRVPITAALALPVIYLLIFSLWHWRTRYAGNHHLAWPILVIVSTLPLFSSMAAPAIVALAYFACNLVPDARGWGAYRHARHIRIHPPASPLPKPYRLAKSACFVVGWTLIIGAMLSAIIACVSDIIIWDSFQETIPHQIGKVITKSIGSVLFASSQIAKATSMICLLSTVAAAIGTLMVQVSQRLRWRLLDELERQTAMESLHAQHRGDGRNEQV